MRKLLKLSAVFALLVTTFFSNVQINEREVEAAETPKFAPEAIPAESDGYSYVKPGVVTNPFTGETVTQVFAWQYYTGEELNGFVAYVPEGSKTLYMTSDFDEMGGVSRQFKPAVFENGGYTGDIIRVQGTADEPSAMLHTSTGEVWYIGLNSHYNARFKQSTSEEISNRVWKKMNVDNMTSAVLAAPTVMYVTEDNGGKLYGNGYMRDYWLYPNRAGWKQDLTTAELGSGNYPKRVFSSTTSQDNDEGSYGNGFHGERLVFVLTDKGLYGTGERPDPKEALGTGNSNRGFEQSKIQTKDGTITNVDPATFKDLIINGGNYINSHLIDTNGKLYTAGVSYVPSRYKGMNVTGTPYANFTGWGKSYTPVEGYGSKVYTNKTDLDGTSWNTNVFAENTAWGENNVSFFPSFGNMSVLKDDGTIWTVGNISAAGVSISNNGDGLNTEACNDSEFCQTIKPLNLYDDTTNSYHWYSTNWNKTEIIKPKYVSHLHGATIAVDQDGFLRIASANDAKEWGKLGYYSQVAFPRVIDGESTIRTSEEFSGVSDETLVTSTTPKYYGNTTNARIPGEFTLVDEVHVANPVYKFEGADAKPDIGKNGEYIDGLYNPTNINIGPAFNGEYSLNKDGSASIEGEGVVLKYKIFKYTTQMELANLQGQLVSEGTATMSETYNLDLSNLEPGEYYITSYREHTTNSAGGQTAGEVYVSDSVMEVFKIPSEPIINVDKVAVVTNDDLSLESTINYAYQRECTEVEANCSNQDKWLTNQVYFDGNIQSFYGENLVSAITNGNVHNGNGGTMSKPVKQKVSASSSDAGVYQVTYSVFAFTGGFFTSENQALVIDDGSIGYTDGDQYAIKSNNIAIKSEEVSGFTDTVFKSSADLAAWKIIDGVVTKVNYQYSLTDANGDAIVKEAEGDYSIPVTITMGGEVVMTKNVTVSVVGDDVEIGDTHAIYALSKVIMLEDVVVGTNGNMTNADALELVEARAWEIATGKTVSVYVNDFMSSPVKKAIGSYYYKLGVNEDNSVDKAVFVNVKDKQTVQDGTHFLRADGFQIGVNTYASASSLTDEMILSEDFTASRAWNNSVYYLDISVIDRSALDFAITNKKPGVYPITLGVDAHPSLQKIIHVIVTDDYTTVGTDYTIRAENFVIDISKVDDYLNDPSLVISNDSGPSSNAQIFNNNDSTDKLTLLVENPLPLEKKGRAIYC